MFDKIVDMQENKNTNSEKHFTSLCHFSIYFDGEIYQKEIPLFLCEQR